MQGKYCLLIMCMCSVVHVHMRVDVDLLYVFLYRNHFQNALATDGEHSATALSVAVWNRKPQVSIQHTGCTE